ncbi:MAG: FkbM family methyltransferase [Gemmatimonadaceae bacterium]
MRRPAGVGLFESAAAVMRALPSFRGKWQAADALRSLLLPLRSGAESRCTVRMKDGSVMTWDAKDADEGRAIFLGVWDDVLREAVVSRLDRASVVLDVGASVGAWTVPLARWLAPEGRLYAFEPVPANRTRLERTVEDNRLTNVVVSPLALGDGRGQVDMWLRSSVTGAETGTAAIVTAGGGHLTVDMQPLDEWADNASLHRLDFIKLDVEGAELMVLEGAHRMVARFRPLILAEFESYWMSTHGWAADDVRGWATAHAYRLLRWDHRARTFLPSDQTGGEDTLLVPEERG